MNIKLTSKKGTNLGSFRTVDGVTYFNPSKQLQSALADKTPSTIDEWKQILALLATSTIEELIPEPTEATSFADL